MAILLVPAATADHGSLEDCTGAADDCAPDGLYGVTFTKTGTTCQFDATISWGDGTTETVTDFQDGQTVSHQYTSHGVFTLTIDVEGTPTEQGAECIATDSNWTVEVPLPSEDSPPPECESDPDAICGDSGDDDLQGTPGDDFIFGGGGDDTIDSGGGNDTIIGGSGNDVLSGGGGDDHLMGGTGKDVLVGDVNTRGRMAEEAAGDDILEGGAGADELLGQAGDDILNGGGGNDVLKGGAGTNILRGGPGNDKCVVTRKDSTKSCETIKKKRRSF